MKKCLYLTHIKPTRKNSLQLSVWLKDNHPNCLFTEVNVARVSHPEHNRGRYEGRVDGPVDYADGERASDRQAISDAARRLLGE